MRGTLRSALIVTAVVLLSVGGAALPSVASHTVSACGRVLDFARPVGTDATSGLGRLRLAVATGEQSFLFLYRDASNAPLLIEPGATQIGAFVCMGGTHVESASSVRSDYVAIYRLVLAVPTSMPATSTAPEQRDFGATITIAGLLAVLIGILRRGVPRAPQADVLVTIAGLSVIEPDHERRKEPRDEVHGSADGTRHSNGTRVTRITSWRRAQRLRLRETYRVPSSPQH